MKSRFLAPILIAASILCIASDCEQRRIEDLDNGLMERPGPDGAVITLHSCTFPIYVSSSSDDDDIEDMTLNAITTINGWIGRVAFAQCLESCDVTVESGYVPAEDFDPLRPTEGEAGIANIDYADDGCILSAEVTISSDIIYDTEFSTLVTIHELLHTLGLSDDPGPPETVDLRSIMSQPLDPLGTLTEADRNLILEMM